MAWGRGCQRGGQELDGAVVKRVPREETESERIGQGVGGRRGAPESMAGHGKEASPDFQSAAGKRPQISWVATATGPLGVLTAFCPFNGLWMGWGRGWWCPSLRGPCPLLDVGFWRSKFDPSLTQRDTFHLNEEFVVPVDMMQARTYPLRWFLLEQPEIQVTFDHPAWARLQGEGGEGRGQGCGAGAAVEGVVAHLSCSAVAETGGSGRFHYAPSPWGLRFCLFDIN